MSQTNAILLLLIAALQGFLIGLERERKREMRGSIFAGIRTFCLISLLGAISGILSHLIGIWIIIATLLGFSGLLMLAYWRASRGEKVGGTSEVAAFVAFGLGVLTGLGDSVVALAGAVITTGILSMRDELHSFAGGISREDLFATVQLAAVSLVILPLIPDQNYGPWEVWNPRSIWWLVVFISSISFVGYIAIKLIGARYGIGISSLLGGLASSTAVTATLSRLSKENKELSNLFTAGTLAASAVMIPRFIILLAVIQPQLIPTLMIPFGALFIVLILSAFVFFWGSHSEYSGNISIANPFELKSAIQFAVIFAFIMLIARAASEFFGSGGVYIASILSGLVRPDAIVLSLGQQINHGLSSHLVMQGLALAVVSNTIFKGMMAYSLGGRQYGRSVIVILTIASTICLFFAFVMPIILKIPD